MRTSSRMKNRIKKMATARDVDLSQPGQHFKVNSPGFMDLVVETIGRNRVSVAHYYEQNGELCQDPEIVFWMCPIDGGWYPIEWTTPQLAIVGGYRKVLYLNEDGTAWEKAATKAQAELAKFGNAWSTNLGRQGFK